MVEERLLTLDEILDGDCELRGPNSTTKLVHSAIGDLVLPTGRIVTRDPMTGPSSPALAIEVAPGRYPATLCKRIGNDHFVQACLLIVRFSPERPASWQQAATPGEDASKLRIGARLAFLVDSATVGIIDESVQARLDDLATRQALIAGFESVVVFGVASVSLLLDASTGATLVATKTEADGHYGAYWGLTESGRPAALVLDLNTLSFAKPSALDTSAIQRRIKQLTLELLSAPDERRQLAAVRELEALGGPEARQLAPLAELRIYTGASEAVRGLVPLVLGRLANADPRLRDDYRSLILTGEPPPRLACGVAVARCISWTEQDIDVAQALLRLVGDATEPRLLGEVIRALPRLRHLLPEDEVERCLGALLKHENEGIRSCALRVLTHEYFEFTSRRQGPAANEARQRLLAWANAASDDPSVVVRLAASEALRRATSRQPAHHARLLRALRDQSSEVAVEMVTCLVRQRAEWAEDVFASVVQCLARLGRDPQLSERARAALGRAQSVVSKPLAPSTAHEPPLFVAGPVELRELPCGKVRLTNSGQTSFEVEARRIFDVSLRPADAGQSWLLIAGCFKPYRFEHVDGTSAIAVGPLPHEHALEVVKRLSYLFTLPVTPEPVAFADLQRSASAFHGMFLETEGVWQLSPEVSALGPLWLTAPSSFLKPLKHGKLRVRVSGICHALPRAKAINLGPPGGYGHIGMWPAELEAYTLTVLGEA